MKMRKHLQEWVSNLNRYVKECSLFFTIFFFTFNLSATTMVDSTYCIGAGIYPWLEWIQNVNLSNPDQTSTYLNHTSAKDGYGGFTDQVATLAKSPIGFSIEHRLEVTAGYSWESFEEYVTAWIDFNQNGFFEIEELIFNEPIQALANGTGSASEWDSFIIPTDALTGPTRLRIAMQRGAFLNDPCMIFTYGEIEDYTVVIEDASEEGCSGDITLSTQAEVDAFGPCSNYDGNILIQGNGITNLEAFAGLKTINGKLEMIATSLTNLDGLSDLEMVDDLFRLENNANLTTFAALSKLTSLGGIILSYMPNLTSLNGLQNLTNNEFGVIDFTDLGISNVDELSGLNQLSQISFDSNLNLTNLDGFATIPKVNFESLNIISNPQLMDLDGLEGISMVDLNIGIIGNERLENITSLESITSIGNDLVIAGNAVLTSLDGLENLSSLGASPGVSKLIIEANISLSDCCALYTLLESGNYDGEIKINNNPAGCNSVQDILTSCSTPSGCGGNITLSTQAEVDAFGPCNYWDGDIEISGVDITDLSALNNLEIVDGDFEIKNNENLLSLEGLNKLKEVLEDLTILDNNQLTALNGLNNLEYVKDDFSISGNDQLTTLNGLDNLGSVSGSFSVRSNDQLASLNGLNNLTEVVGGLFIGNNDQLINLNGLNNLEKVRSIDNVNDEFFGLHIYENDNLQSLSGLDNLVEVSGKLLIKNNASLIDLNGLPLHNTYGLIIESNPELVTLNGLENTTILYSEFGYGRGFVSIKDNPKLINIEAINLPNELRGLNFIDNPILTDLSKIANIDDVDNLRLINNGNTNVDFLNNFSRSLEEFVIRGNLNLTNLDGLISLSRIHRFDIKDNPLLNSCCLIIDEEIWMDYLFVENNATGCNSEADIIATCDEPSEPTDYCTSQSDRPWEEWIANVSFAGIDNASGKCHGGICGYSDFTALSGAIIPGSHLPIGLIPGKSWFNRPADLYWRVWIDYNADGDFEDADELVFEKFGANQAVFGSIDIPDNVSLGNTRMRVAAKKGAYADPCESFEKGEVEDYTIQILSSTKESQVEQAEVYFNALKNGRTTLLNWTRTTEYDNDYFELERSFDGTNFETIHNVDRTQEVATTYRFTDNNPQAGINYYRLKTVFADGTIAYSKTRTVAFEKAIADITLFPNPATDELFIDLKQLDSEVADLQIYNQLGQPLFQQQLTEFGDAPIRVDLQDFRSGVYHLMIKAEGRKLIARKFVVSQL